MSRSCYRGQGRPRHRRIARHRPRDRARARRRGRRASRSPGAAKRICRRRGRAIESAGPGARRDAARRRARSYADVERAIAATVGALRRPRHPGQQRRRRHLRRRRRHDAGAVVRGHRHEPDRRVQRLPRGASAPAPARRRLHHQHQQPGRQERLSPARRAYCASKAGLNAFSEALMQEVRYDDIRVSYVMPGSVATGFARRRRVEGRRLEDCAGRSRRSRPQPAAPSAAQPAEPRRAAAVEAAEEIVKPDDPCLSSTSTATRSSITRR